MKLVKMKKGEQRTEVSVSRATKLATQGWSFDVNISAEPAPVVEEDCGCGDKEPVAEEPVAEELAVVDGLFVEETTTTKKTKRKKK